MVPHIMLSAELLAVLCCPTCRQRLQFDEAVPWLTCGTCQVRYPVCEGIPNLLTEEAQPIADK